MTEEFRSNLASKHIGQQVTVRGWVANLRSSGKIFFLQLRDGWGYLQAVVAEDQVDAQTWQNCQQLTLESSVLVTGIISQHPKHADQYEVQVQKVEIVHIAAEYPIGNKEHGPDFLLDQRHLWLRSSKQVAIQKIRNTIINAIYQFLNDDGFTKIDSPILTPSAC